MKNPTKYLLWALCCFAFVAMAQTNTNTIPVTPGGTVTPATAWFISILPLIVPIIIAGFKAVAPNIPKFLLPIIAPILAALLDYLASMTPIGTGTAHPILAAALGSAGVGVREILDQVKLRVSANPQPPTT